MAFCNILFLCCPGDGFRSVGREGGEEKGSAGVSLGVGEWTTVGLVEAFFFRKLLVERLRKTLQYIHQGLIIYNQYGVLAPFDLPNLGI